MDAAAPLFLAEYHRRGLWFTRERGFFQGGSNVVVLRPARLWSRGLWLLVSILVWGALIAVPVHYDITTDVFDRGSPSAAVRPSARFRSSIKRPRTPYTPSCVPVPDPGWLAWIVWIAVGCALLALLGCLKRLAER